MCASRSLPPQSPCGDKRYVPASRANSPVGAAFASSDIILIVGTFAAGGHRRYNLTGLVPCPVAAELLNELVVNAQDEKGRRPLSHKQGAMVIAKYLHYQRY